MAGWLVSLTLWFDDDVGTSMHLSELRTVEGCQKFLRAASSGDEFLRQAHCALACDFTEKN